MIHPAYNDMWFLTHFYLGDLDRAAGAPRPDPVGYFFDPSLGKVRPLSPPGEHLPHAPAPAPAPVGEQDTGAHVYEQPGHFTSVDHATRWLEQNYPHLDAEGLSGLDLPTLNPTVRQFHILGEHFPEVSENIHWLGLSHSDQVLGLGPAEDAGELVLSQPVLTGEHYLADLGTVEGGRVVHGSATPGGMVTRAFARVLSKFLGDADDFHFLPVTDRADQFGNVAATFRHFLAANFDPESLRSLSEQAAEDGHSAFEEAMVALYHDPGAHSHPFVQKVISFLGMLSDKRGRGFSHWMPADTVTPLDALRPGAASEWQRAMNGMRRLIGMPHAEGVQTEIQTARPERDTRDDQTRACFNDRFHVAFATELSGEAGQGARDVAQVARSLFGPAHVPDDQGAGDLGRMMGHLVGAMDGSRVTATARENSGYYYEWGTSVGLYKESSDWDEEDAGIPEYARHELDIKVEHPLMRSPQHRQIRYVLDEDGQEKLVIRNAYFALKGAPKRTGARILMHQVRAARRFGVDALHTDAAGDYEQAQQEDGYSGYVVWPSLGYDGPLTSQEYDMMDAAMKARVRALQIGSVQELLAQPGIAKWWEQHAMGRHLTFDLADDSPSMKVLRQYARTRGIVIGKDADDFSRVRVLAMARRDGGGEVTGWFKGPDGALYPITKAPVEKLPPQDAPDIRKAVRRPGKGIGDGRDGLTREWFNGRFTLDISKTEDVRPIEQWVRESFGKSLDYRCFAEMVGAPDGAKVALRFTGAGVRVEAHHPLFREPQIRKVYGNLQRGVRIENSRCTLAENAPAGLGLRILAHQVAAAMDLGVVAIHTLAAGEAGSPFRGYYTWPRLGFNAPLETADIARMPERLRRIVRHLRVSDLNGLMAAGTAHPDLLAWWKAEGWGRQMTLSLDPESTGVWVLHRFRLESDVRIGCDLLRADVADAARPEPTGWARLPIEIDESVALDDADEAALERAWAWVIDYLKR